MFAKRCSNLGRIFSRDQLIDAICPEPRIVSDQTIDSHIKKLRLKIAEIRPGIKLIHLVYGLG